MAMTGWFPSRLLRWLVNGGLSNPDVGAQHPNIGGSTDLEVGDERALAISAVYRCISLLTNTVACMPLGFFTQAEDGGRTEIPKDHYLPAILKKRPNPLMTALQFRTAMTSSMVGWGNAYAEVGRIGGLETPPRMLMPLDAGRMTPHRMKDGSVQYHYQTPNGIKVYAAPSILHLKGFTVDGVVGLSPLSIGRYAIGLTVAAEQYSASNFTTGGRPVGTLNFDKFLTPEQREQARKVYQGITAGADNATNAWVLEGGSTYSPVGISPDDMQMLESRRFQLGEIARLFGVPSHLINDSEKATTWGSGLEQLNLSFLQYTLTPYLKAWETSIVDSLLTPVDREKIIVEHNVEGLLRADSVGRASFYATMSQNALMTRNEIRKKENLPAMEGGDELTLQSNMQLLSALAMLLEQQTRQPTQQPPPPGGGGNQPPPDDDEEDA